MPEHLNKIETPPVEAKASEVSLMLRAHAELRCLSREVIPVLRQVETRDGLPSEQLGAAMAYLEVTWLEARQRAQETDCVRRELAAARPSHAGRGDDRLHNGACRYYEAVRVLRDAVQRRVGPMLGACASACSELERQA